MEDTLIMVADSALHTADHLLHSAPGEGANFTQWIGWGVAVIMGVFGWFQYKKSMKRK